MGQDTHVRDDIQRELRDSGAMRSKQPRETKLLPFALPAMRHCKFTHGKLIAMIFGNG